MFIETSKTPSKRFIRYPKTIIFKMRNIGIAKYQVLIFGVFGSLTVKMSAAFMCILGSNVVCLLDGDLLNRVKSEAYSESLKLYKIFFSLHKCYWTSLRIIGLGYKVIKDQDRPKTLTLKLGFSHPIVCNIPIGVYAYARKRIIKLWSHSYDLLKSFSYKLLGIKRQKDSFRAAGLIPANIKIRLKVGKISRA